MTISRAFRIIFEERLGDPIQRAQAESTQAAEKIKRRLSQNVTIPTTGLVVFIHPAAIVEVKGSPVPVCTPKNLFKKIPINQPLLPKEVYQDIQTVLDEVAASKNGF